MLHRSIRGLAAVIGLLLVSSVHAQSTPAAGSADPLNAKAQVPAATHKSALSGYRPAGEVKVGSWREANDAVARIGGWRAYAREASQPEATPASAAAPAPGATPAAAPASAPVRPAGDHGQHGKH